MEGHTANKVLGLGEGEKAGASLHVPEANLGETFLKNGMKTNSFSNKAFLG